MRNSNNRQKRKIPLYEHVEVETKQELRIELEVHLC